MSEIRVIPHPRITVVEWDIDNKPASVIVELSDNTREIYDRRIQQPGPKFKAVLDLIDKLPVYGPSANGYKGRHEKK